MLGSTPTFATETTNPAFSNPNPIFLTIPETGVIHHAQMRLSGDLLYFNTSELNVNAPTPDTTQSGAFHYTSDLAFGFENRAEVSFQFGKAFSLGLKALLVEEDVYLPNVIFGIRNLFQSQEATLYGIPDSLGKSLRGESYFGLAKHLSQNTRLHVGASLLNGVNKGPVGMYGGFEWELGAGAVASYEVFERFSDFHQLLGLSWRFGQMFSMTLAFSEFQSWVRQSGEWGFYTAPSQPQTNGYDSPGIRFSMSVYAFMPKVDHRTLAERVADLERKNQTQLQDMETLRGRLTTLKMEQDAARRAIYQLAAGNRNQPTLEGPAADFRVLVDLYTSDNIDPVALRNQVEKLLAYKERARPVIEKAANDTAAGEDSRVTALLAMGSSQDTIYVAQLTSLCRDRNPRIRREALTALAKLKPKSLEGVATSLLKDPDEAVALTAQGVLKDLGLPSEIPATAPKATPNPGNPPPPKPSPTSPTSPKTKKGPATASQAPRF